MFAMAIWQYHFLFERFITLIGILLDFTGFMFYEEKNSQNVQSQTKKFRSKKFAIKEEALGQFFLDYNRSAQVTIIKNIFFLFIVIFFEFQPKFPLKG